MDFDHTRIAIRERTVLETLDLTVQTVRVFARPLLFSLGLVALPLSVLNYYLLRDLLAVNPADYTEEEWVLRVMWYLAELALLVAIQAPFASVLATTYLGKATFVEKPDVKEVARETRAAWLPIVWCLLIVRGVLPAVVVVGVAAFSAERTSSWEFPLLAGIVLWIVLLRAARPFVPEVILLERKPLRSPGKDEMSVGRRASVLHGFGSSDHVTRWFASAAASVVMVVSLYQMLLFVQGLFLNQWSVSSFLLLYLLPVAMWIVVGFMTVFRFLSYLDLRIRNEGWEVELRLRAEASRIAHSIS